MPYALESKKEFERLEHQSTLPKYDYKKELAELKLKENAKVLDAGSGSGVVSRYIAQKNPSAKVIGCDMSQDRVTLANEAAAHLSNVSFERADLTKLRFESNTFDAIVCRYVLEHLTPKVRSEALIEMFRCLKPGGALYAIDFDGPLFNVFPQTDLITETLRLLEKSQLIDLQIGRKMPHLLHQTGFENPSWRIETIECSGESLKQERKLWPEKLETAAALFAQILGSKRKALQFNKEFLETLARPDVVLFYNKFTVIGQKPSKKSKLKLVKD
ncbi:MAG: class I SAM-dependent methyltransferase [Bdellovibrionota bacterium]